MLSINGKKFMNLPEAVQWLLNNNALPFQCKANYVADTVIAKSDIINPSPAEIKVGSLVLFADSKVGTVSGVTDSGFMVGQDYTDIGAQLNQITDIDIDASGHLIFTMGNGSTIDAGLIKEITGFSIDASQHLIASYSDGSTQDLGPIFQGNVNITGSLTAGSIVENMSGYSFIDMPSETGLTVENIYKGAVKNGNKLTLVQFFKITKDNTYAGADYHNIGTFVLPVAVANKIYPNDLGGGNTLVAFGAISLFYTNALTKIDKVFNINKYGLTNFSCLISGLNSMTDGVTYYGRIETTFLLSDSL